jgi:hypothetical protein
LSATIWFKEPGKPDTWHILTERLSYGWYRMACAWESRLANAEGLWPAKTSESGPPRRERCSACTVGYAMSARLERSFGEGNTIEIGAR